ncbi:thioredoxin family protein [Flavobacterium sp. DG1-102-2]|uniref:thioredoxin family protein n=1 Tax=Flavobacterium sp. DG1-102-2 TaxID=3081663 RepID=UPI0029496B4C|nr:thioredoxin fold domain-containing protein [Flavobacterium sp. DG1-102-2]MDV6168952.1 thioredoxin family protein [Flavobacterium sp. DG1-102-2]
MKKILLALFLTLGAVTVQAQEIKWMTMDEALVAQKKKAKPIFMDVYTDWCGPCKILDKVTFHDAEVVKYISDNYYAVKFNAEGNSEVNYLGKKYANPQYDASRKGRNAMHQFAASLNLEGYPSMVIFDAKTSKVKGTIVGNHTPPQLLEALKTK